MKPLAISRMTLTELQEAKRSLTSVLLGDTANWDDAKQFKQICDAIRGLKEAKDWAAKLNGGKVSEADISMRKTTRCASCGKPIRHDDTSCPHCLATDFET